MVGATAGVPGFGAPFLATQTSFMKPPPVGTMTGTQGQLPGITPAATPSVGAVANAAPKNELVCLVRGLAAGVSGSVPQGEQITPAFIVGQLLGSMLPGGLLGRSNQAVASNVAPAPLAPGTAPVAPPPNALALPAPSPQLSPAQAQAIQSQTRGQAQDLITKGFENNGRPKLILIDDFGGFHGAGMEEIANPNGEFDVMRIDISRRNSSDALGDAAEYIERMVNAGVDIGAVNVSLSFPRNDANVQRWNSVLNRLDGRTSFVVSAGNDGELNPLTNGRHLVAANSDFNNNGPGANVRVSSRQDSTTAANNNISNQTSEAAAIVSNYILRQRANGLNAAQAEQLARQQFSITA